MTSIQKPEKSIINNGDTFEVNKEEKNKNLDLNNNFLEPLDDSMSNSRDRFFTTTAVSWIPKKMTPIRPINYPTTTSMKNLQQKLANLGSRTWSTHDNRNYSQQFGIDEKPISAQVHYAKNKTSLTQNMSTNYNRKKNLANMIMSTSSIVSYGNIEKSENNSPNLHNNTQSTSSTKNKMKSISSTLLNLAKKPTQVYLVPHATRPQPCNSNEKKKVSSPYSRTNNIINDKNKSFERYTTPVLNTVSYSIDDTDIMETVDDNTSLNNLIKKKSDQTQIPEAEEDYDINDGNVRTLNRMKRSDDYYDNVEHDKNSSKKNLSLNTVDENSNMNTGNSNTAGYKRINCFQYLG